MFLFSNNPTPCFGDTVDLISATTTASVMVRVSKQPRYAATTASFKRNDLFVFPVEDVFDQS